MICIIFYGLTLLIVGFELLVTIYNDILFSQITSFTVLHVIGIIGLFVSAFKVKRNHAQQVLSLENRLLSFETAATEKSNLLTALLDNMPCAIATITTDFGIRNVNTELTNLTGVQKDDALGKRCFDVFGIGQICPNCPVKRAIESGKVQQNVKLELSRNGKELYLEQIAIPILNSEGKIQHILEIVVDATEKTALQKRHDTLFLQTVTALVQLIESRDKYTGSHSHRVRNIAVEIGTELNFEPPQLEELAIAAALHDIGKIGIPEEILNKPGKLTAKEYEIIKEHPTIGYSALNNVDSLKQFATIIVDHHERLDGMGYPSGKKGQEISLAARILSVADVYEAITTDRIYRSAMMEEEAIAIINAGRGTQFDPDVVDALIRLIAKCSKYTSCKA